MICLPNRSNNRHLSIPFAQIARRTRTFPRGRMADWVMFIKTTTNLVRLTADIRIWCKTVGNQNFIFLKTIFFFSECDLFVKKEKLFISKLLNILLSHSFRHFSTAIQRHQRSTLAQSMYTPHATWANRCRESRLTGRLTRNAKILLATTFAIAEVVHLLISPGWKSFVSISVPVTNRIARRQVREQGGIQCVSSLTHCTRVYPVASELSCKVPHPLA